MNTTEQTATATHTKGPWQCVSDHPDEDTRKSFIEIYPADRTKYSNVIACIYAAPEGSQRRADAELIAAAPTTLADRDRLKEVNAILLEALKDVMSEADFGDSELAAKCRSAISRASAK